MIDTQPPEENPKPDRRRRRKPRLHHRFSIGLWMVLTNLVLAALLIYIALSLTEGSLTAPNWLTQRIEAEANSALPEGRLSLGRLAIRVNDAGLPAAQVTNLGIFDDRGAEIARLNQVSVRLAPVSLLKGELKPRHLDIAGAQITVRRLADGQFDLSFSGGAAATGSLATLLDSLDAVFGQAVMAEVTDVNASDLTITLEDARTGRIWQITDGRLTARRLRDGLDISVGFDVFNGTEELAETTITIRTDTATSAASFGASFRNAAAADIALQSPALAYLGVVNAPISGSVRTEMGVEGEVKSLTASLEIGRGALQPTPATRPIGFDSAGAFLSFDPAHQRITFSEVNVQSDSMRVVAKGQAYLRDFNGPWPTTLLGQFQLSELTANPGGMWQQAFKATSGAADMRIRLDPFEVEFGQISVISDQERFAGRAALRAEEKGWQGSADLELERIGVDRLEALWPSGVVARTRAWLAENVPSGQLRNLRVSARLGRDGKPQYEAGFSFADAAIRAVKGFPLLFGAGGYGVFQGQSMTLVLEEGRMTSPLGQPVDFAGTVLQSDDLSVRPATARATVRAKGRAQDILAILALPPVNALAESDLAPDFLDGQGNVEAVVNFPMVKEPPPGALTFDATGTISAARSDQLLPGQTVTAPALQVRADNARVEVEGAFAIGAVAGQAIWQKMLDRDHAGQSRLTGEVELSADTVKQFDLGLPDGSVGGLGTGDIDLKLVTGAPPELTVNSTLDGLVLSLPEIGWTKPADQTGALHLITRFADTPEVSELSLTTQGLTVAGGTIAFDAAGGFSQAVLADVKAGAWLDAPVILDSRGGDQVPAITVAGGSVDLSVDLPGTAGAGAGGPIDVRLDSVRVSSSISVTDVVGQLSTNNGLSGRFTGRINGGAPITGQLEQMQRGTGARIQAANAGRAMADTGIFTSADGGQLDLTLTPWRPPVRYRGELTISNTNVQRAPVLTELLSALSVVGLLDQMRGAGIVFSDVQADLDILEHEVRLLRSSAVGPSLGVSMDGIYDLDRSEMNMQGVISPVYFLNAIGQLVSPRRGEGLFGFNFFLKGPSDAPTVQVNPLSILTPGLFRDIFRAPPPEPKK